MMTLERAHLIVQAVNARCFVILGIKDDLPSLEGVTLGEMLEATAMVRNKDEATAAAAKITGGSYSISIVPDDRLIAAVYAIEHYPIGNEPILALPHGPKHLRALAVVRIRAEELECTE